MIEYRLGTGIQYGHFDLHGGNVIATKCAFIISPSYSGSTLLSMLLAHHPDLVTLGEYLDNRERRYQKGEGDFCSCGEKLASCPYMADLAQRINAQGTEFSVDYPDTAFRSGDKLTNSILRAYIRGSGFELLRSMAIPMLPPVRKTVRRISDRNNVVISTLLEKVGATVYLDSAKNNNRVIYFDRYAHEINVKAIWLIRDGRGVTNSIMKHYKTDVESAVRRWVTTQNSVIQTTKMIANDQILTLKYEDLCGKPEIWLPEVCKFLDLDPAKLPETYGDKELHLTGNNMRLRGLGEIRLDEKWKMALSAADLEVFEKIGGDLNKELGYEPVSQAGLS